MCGKQPEVKAKQKQSKKKQKSLAVCLMSFLCSCVANYLPDKILKQIQFNCKRTGKATPAKGQLQSEEEKS